MNIEVIRGGNREKTNIILLKYSSFYNYIFRYQLKDKDHLDTSSKDNTTKVLPAQVLITKENYQKGIRKELIADHVTFEEWEKYAEYMLEDLKLLDFNRKEFQKFVDEGIIEGISYKEWIEMVIINRRLESILNNEDKSLVDVPPTPFEEIYPKEEEFYDDNYLKLLIGDILVSSRNTNEYSPRHMGILFEKDQILHISEKSQILEVISLEDWESIYHANGEQSPIYRFINNSESRNRIANWVKDQAKKANTSKIAFQLIKHVKNKNRSYDTHLVLQALSEGLSGEFEFDLEDSLITFSDLTS